LKLFSIKLKILFSYNNKRQQTINKNKGRCTMTNLIEWEKDMDSALERAQSQNLPILLFFHNPG